MSALFAELIGRRSALEQTIAFMREIGSDKYVIEAMVAQQSKLSDEILAMTQGPQEEEEKVVEKVAMEVDPSPAAATGNCSRSGPSSSLGGGTTN